MEVTIESGLDPRCFSPTKLKPPYPLPFVSRRSLQKVLHRIKPPQSCHSCGWINVELVNNTEIYGGREFGTWPYAYLCRSCGAYVSLHPKTDLPTGTMVGAAVRDARRAAKIPFTCLVKVKFGGKRGAAYSWLSNAIGVNLQVCHFSMFDEDVALAALEACYNELFLIP
jgi:rubredoxin